MREKVYMAGKLVLILSLALSLLGIAWADEESKERWDLLTIDTLKQFGDLERPTVLFGHDMHTKALEKEGKNCQTCHKQGEKYLSQKFLRFEDGPDKETMMDHFHANCQGCHKEMKAQGKESGPVVCGECHAIEPEYVSNRVLIPMDLSLHARHIKELKADCGKCHHTYDDAAHGLVYKKGTESNCRDCHDDGGMGRSASMQTASHKACVTCHMERAGKNLSSGPVECAGCHKAEKTAEIKKMARVPRLQLNDEQPDVVRLVPSEADNANARMTPVPFNHKGHENYTGRCRDCHHDTMQACNECHTVKGDYKGGEANLEAAFHAYNAEQSCVGCHNAHKKEPECAGCHTFMSNARLADHTCTKCHFEPPKAEVPAEAGEEGDAQPTENTSAMAAFDPETVPYPEFTFASSEIPEKVTIDILQNKYGPSVFPHKQIIEALRKGVAESRMAKYFHGGEDTLCAGCHHHSPVGQKPPMCVNCHEKEGRSERNMFGPGLQGAYHQQCIGCHEKMDVAMPMNCVQCHSEKADAAVH